MVDATVCDEDDVVLQTLEGYGGESLPPLDVPYSVRRDLPDPTVGRSPSNLMRRSLARSRAVRRFDPEIVHLELLDYRVDWALAPLLRGWRRRRRLTAAVHDVRPHTSTLPQFLDNVLLRRLYRGLDALVVYHEALRTQLMAEFDVPAERIFVVPPAIEVDGEHRQDSPADRNDVLFFGTFRPNKGIGLLVEAINQLPEAPGKRFVFAGTGETELQDEVRALASHRGDTYAEIAQLTPDRVEEVLRAARVLVLPYTSFASQSGVLIDAYRYCIPLIVSDVGAIGDTVRTDGSGWVVQPGSVVELQRAIEEARTSDAAIQQRSDAIRQSLRKHDPPLVGRALRSALLSPARVPRASGLHRIVGTRRFRVRPSAVRATVRRVRAHPSNRGRALRTAARVLRCEVQARITGRPVLTRLGERSRIYAHLHVGGSWRVVYANPPDHAEMAVWRRVLRPGDLFVDVGAHVGVYSLWAIETGAHVIAIEPVPQLVSQLRRNLSINGYQADVHAVAVGDRPGSMSMTGPDLLRVHFAFHDEAGTNVRCEADVQTLDHIVGDRRVAGMKIDVEGAERLVLQGAERLLRENRIGLIQLEWNECSRTLLGEDRRSIAALLDSHGYELCRPDERGVLVPTRDISDGPDMFARPATGTLPES